MLQCSSPKDYQKHLWADKLCVLLGAVRENTHHWGPWGVLAWRYWNIYRIWALDGWFGRVHGNWGSLLIGCCQEVEAVLWSPRVLINLTIVRADYSKENIVIGKNTHCCLGDVWYFVGAPVLLLSVLRQNDAVVMFQLMLSWSQSVLTDVDVLCNDLCPTEEWHGWVVSIRPDSDGTEALLCQASSPCWGLPFLLLYIQYFKVTMTQPNNN